MEQGLSGAAGDQLRSTVMFIPDEHDPACAAIQSKCASSMHPGRQLSQPSLTSPWRCSRRALNCRKERSYRAQAHELASPLYKKGKYLRRVMSSYAER